MSTQNAAERNDKNVREFIAAWSRLSSEPLMPYFAADAVYQNMPWPALEGAVAVRGFMDAFFPMTDWIRFDILNLVATDRLVFTERVDRFHLKNGAKIDLPVNGVFELDASGKITAWRDYFDVESWLSQGGPAIG